MNLFVLPLFAFSAILLGQQGTRQAAQNTINSTGSQSINVNTNNGLIVVQPTISPQAATQFKEHAKARGKVSVPKNLLLPAGDKVDPPTCSFPIPSHSLTVELGGGPAVFCVNDACPIIIEGAERYMTVFRKKDGSLVLDAQIFGEDRKILAAIEHNTYYVNKSNPHLFHFDRPDASTLLVRDDENRTAVKVRFVRRDTIRVEGRFFTRTGNLLSITADGLALRYAGSTRDNLSLKGGCQQNATFLQIN